MSNPLKLNYSQADSTKAEGQQISNNRKKDILLPYKSNKNKGLDNDDLLKIHEFSKENIQQPFDNTNFEDFFNYNERHKKKYDFLNPVSLIRYIDYLK